MSSTPRPIQYLSNAELYSRWAKVYDTDGNILQAIDDALLPALLSHVFDLLSECSPITITDLGCGTGRNTMKLLNPSLLPVAQVNALDLSPGMLAVAKTRCNSFLDSTSGYRLPSINFYEFDALHPSQFPSVQAIQGSADLILSTLVLEHLPIDIFFASIKGFLKVGGYAVITNMHPEMGRIGQAGFVDAETGVKVRGSSFVYEVAQVVEEGRKWGFEVLGNVGEKGVSEEDVGNVAEGKLVGERGRKWIGVKCWFGLLLRLRGV